MSGLMARLRSEVTRAPAAMLLANVRQAWIEAGQPGYRVIARATGYSHTTVGHLINGDRIPTWGVIEKVMAYLNADPTQAHDYYVAAFLSDEETPMSPKPGPEHPDGMIGVRDALSRAVSSAQREGDATGWALVAIALHLTGQRAVLNSHGEYEILDQRPRGRNRPT